MVSWSFNSHDRAYPVAGQRILPAGKRRSSALGHRSSRNFPQLSYRHRPQLSLGNASLICLVLATCSNSTCLLPDGLMLVRC